MTLPDQSKSRERPAERHWVPASSLAPGRRAMMLAAITIGVLLLGVQLWLLTVAVDLYLGGEAREAWTLAAASGLVFLGGVFAYLLLRHDAPRDGG